MTLAAPPDLADIPPHAVEDAVIKEARRRARRRRIAQGVVLAMLLAAAVALFGPRDGSPPSGAGAPQAGQVDGSGGGASSNGAQLVMQWGEVHVGWVLVYGDGRALWYPDHGPVFERRLTPAGLALVRSGAVNWHDFLRASQAVFPANAWFEPASREYRPAAYAVCLWVGSNMPGDASDLPAAARALLHDAPRVPAGHVVSASYEADTWNCLRLNAADRDELRRTAVRRGDWDWGEDLVFPTSADGSTVRGELWPVMPHGEWVAWGG